MKDLKLYSFLVIGLFCLAGCAPNRPIPSEGDSRYWRNIPESEKGYYKSSRDLKDGVPKLGLALSGGGQRAASVSIGFLEALHRNKKLEKIDVISSVSGGSYAAYWWYSKDYWSKNSPPDTQQYGNQDVFFRRFSYKEDSETWLCKVRDGCQDRESCSEILQCTEKDKIDRCGLEVCRTSSPQTTYDDFPYFFHLFNHGQLVTWYQEGEGITINDVSIFEWKWGEEVLKAVTLFPTMPINWIANGLFDMKLNVNPFQAFYRYGIERDYGLYPMPGEYLKSYANADDFVSPSILPRRGARDPGNMQLFDEMKKQKLPYWIINSTAAYGTRPVPKMLRNGGEWTGYSNDLQHTVYEFTPISQGSPWWGYCGTDDAGCSKEEIKLSREVAISGAAIDSLNEFANSAIDLLNVSLGQYIDNPFSSGTDRMIHRLLPNPLAQVHYAAHDENAPFIYLSDGGHSDNLGLYSLVRRGVKEIVVVDAAQESNNGSKFHASFDGLQQARIHLWQEHGVLIDVRELFGDRPVSDQPIAPATLHFDYMHAKDSILQGWICPASPEQTHCKEGDPATLKLWYVKLSIDKNEISKAYNGEKRLDSKSYEGCKAFGKPASTSKTKYSCTTLLYASKDSGSDYPHDSTFDINYSAEQASGYIALGYDLGNQFLTELKSSCHQFWD
jgi:hypothetical protein